MPSFEANMSNQKKCQVIRKEYSWELVKVKLIEYNNKYLDRKIVSSVDVSLLSPIIVKDYLEAQRWKTSLNPYVRHQYLFRDRLVREKVFTKLELKVLDEIAEYIHENGVEEEWRGRTYSYLYLGEYKYWTMWKTQNKMASVNRWWR